MKPISKGADKLRELITKAAEFKKIIDYDSKLVEQGLADSKNETLEERRVREFGCGEVSYEAFDNWGVYLKERSQNAANSKKKKV